MTKKEMVKKGIKIFLTALYVAITGFMVLSASWFAAFSVYDFDELARFGDYVVGGDMLAVALLCWLLFMTLNLLLSLLTIRSNKVSSIFSFLFFLICLVNTVVIYLGCGGIC